MEARIVIDLGTATPPYEQIQSQIGSLIAVGQLRAGTRLPTVRSLAADLGVAAGTVARAYKELEAAGTVTTNRRQGTVVAGIQAAQPVVSTGSAGGQREVMAAVEHLIRTGRLAGLDDKTILALLRGSLQQSAPPAGRFGQGQ
ncbi:GntR family transcriptional regulator [Arthrobacter sp. ERGS1:01]|uniref:GntR family transcriptional regulator n=1 Tax=Arthrobacter sp. ERGS1:01 TaxID=1704044 RepID=UPI0006B537D5|nr:GntR family transcriptional regulator [Arthrobacter sp. ERGS1:01]ALE07061.1 GntR family transcriptional regulator [Arthrobacter sp. ERGS1:01]